MTTLTLDQLVYIAAAFDPASSKTPIKSVRARQAIAVVGVDVTSRIFCLFSWAGRLPIAKLYDKILQINDDWHPRVFGVEANAMQAFVGEALSLEAKRRMKHLPIVPVYPPTKVDKDFRIRTVLQPVIGWGRLFVPVSMVELRNELMAFPVSPLKDMVDVLAQAIALLPVRTSMAKRTHTQQSGLEKYLRETGASPDYIQTRLEQIRSGRMHVPLDSDEAPAYTQR